MKGKNYWKKAGGRFPFVTLAALAGCAYVYYCIPDHGVSYEPSTDGAAAARSADML